MEKKNRSIWKWQMHNFIANDWWHSYICLRFLSIKKINKINLRKLISHCICKAFWDTRTPGGSCLRTINNFADFALGFLWENRRQTCRFVCLRWVQRQRDGKWMRDREGGAGFICNGWLAETGNWLFFISPVVVKEAPVTTRAMSPGHTMFPWQREFALSSWFVLSFCMRWGL